MYWGGRVQCLWGLSSLTSQKVEVSCLPVAQAKVGTIEILRVSLSPDAGHTSRGFSVVCS